MDKVKIVVSYRVIQGWRVPVFERLSQLVDVELLVLHGTSFKGTKVVNYDKTVSFDHKELPTIPLNIPTKNGRAIMPVSPTIFWELIKFSPDVIICEGASNLANNVLTFIYKVVFRKKMIWWSLGEIKNRKKSSVRKVLEFPINFLEKRMDAIISYSSIGAEYFYRLGIKKEKVFVAVNVIDTEKKLNQISTYDKEKVYAESHQNSDFNILFVGAITKEKRLDILLKAFKKFETDRNQVKLTIIGDGSYLEEIKQLSVKLELKNIVFEGQIIEGISKYFLSSDIFVLPGLGGLAVSDSLVHGVPVIASIADGCEKDLLESGAGIIEEDMTVDILYAHLKDLHNNPEKLKKMKEEAVNIINNRYNISNYVQSIKGSIDYVL